MAHLAHRGGCARANQPLLKRELIASVGDDRRGAGLVAHRQNDSVDAELPTQCRGHLGQRLAAGQRARANQVGDQVAIAELKPVLEPAALRLVECAEGVSLDPPTAVLGCEPCERVHDGIEVGGDVEAPVREVIARVDDDPKSARRKRAVETIDEARTAHAAGKRNDRCL